MEQHWVRLHGFYGCGRRITTRTAIDCCLDSEQSTAERRYCVERGRTQEHPALSRILIRSASKDLSRLLTVILGILSDQIHRRGFHQALVPLIAFMAFIVCKRFYDPPKVALEVASRSLATAQAGIKDHQCNQRSAVCVTRQGQNQDGTTR
jgi:hypothetical protein